MTTLINLSLRILKKRIDRSASRLSTRRQHVHQHVTFPQVSTHQRRSTRCRLRRTALIQPPALIASSHVGLLLIPPISILQWLLNNLQISEHLPVPSFWKISTPHGHTRSTLSTNRHELIFLTVSSCSTSQVQYLSHAISPCHLKFRPDRLTHAHTQSLNSPRSAGCDDRFRGQSLDAMQGAA